MAGSDATPTDFSDALRKAIAAAGVTLATLSGQLNARGFKVSVSALSHWSSGRRRPERAESLNALLALEEVLGLMPGELSDLLGGPRHRGRTPRTIEFAHRVPERDRFQRALAELGFDDVRVYPHLQTLHSHTYVGADRAHRRYEFTHVYRAIVDGPVRFTNIQFIPGPPICDFAGRGDDFFVDVEGASLGRTVAWPEDNLVGAEFIVSEGAQRGDVFVISYAIELPKGYRLDAAEFATVRRVRDILMMVSFDGEIPAEMVEIDQVGAELNWRPIDAAKRVVSLHQDIGPGVAGVRWRWRDCESEIDLEPYER